jgi:endonuclease/exonuclease/phosphatase family metal-dependent hydrolase
MAFNIRHGCGVESWGNTTSGFFKGCTKKLDRVVSAISSADPDVVGLQEVDIFHVADIAKALNMNFAYSTHNPRGYGGWWGNAVLSKFKILESKTTPVGGTGEINRSIVTAIALVNGQHTAFVSVHTDHRLDSDSSVRRILSHVKSLSVPTILIGDFNMTPGDHRISLITEQAGFIDTAAAVRTGRAMGTYGRTPSGGRRIDYVFVQSSFFEVLDAAMVSDEHYDASDHIAYYAKVKWK